MSLALFLLLENAGAGREREREEAAVCRPAGRPAELGRAGGRAAASSVDGQLLTNPR